MDIFAQYAVDPKLEHEGKPHDMGGGVTLMIARSYSPTYQRMLNQLYEAHKHTLDQKDTDEQIAAGEARSVKIMAEVMAHTVLVGWTGPVEYQKEPLPYSIENAKKLLMLKEFQKLVGKVADDYKNYRFAMEEEDTKNSSPTSSGTSLGVASVSISSN